MGGIGKVLLVLGQIAGGIAYIGTVGSLLADGRTALALVAFFVPPADLLLVFLTPFYVLFIAAVILTLLGLGAMALGERGRPA